MAARRAQIVQNVVAAGVQDGHDSRGLGCVSDGRKARQLAVAAESVKPTIEERHQAGEALVRELCVQRRLRRRRRGGAIIRVDREYCRAAGRVQGCVPHDEAVGVGYERSQGGVKVPSPGGGQARCAGGLES